MAKVPYGGPQHRMRKVKGGVARILKPEHPAIVDRTALFRKGIEHASTSPRLLVDGENQRKVGKRITKGAWKGIRIFTLTLVERATCPSSCQQWLSCYGNGMPYARRHILDRALIARLGPEIAGLIAKHGRIAVRLHVLGDFGSETDLDLAIAYVAAWRWAMMSHEGLHLFGYTAHAPGGAIGREIGLAQWGNLTDDDGHLAGRGTWLNSAGCALQTMMRLAAGPDPVEREIERAWIIELVRLNKGDRSVMAWAWSYAYRGRS